MNTHSKWLTAMLLPVALIAGCKGAEQPPVAKAPAVKQETLGNIEYPALPVIRNALFSMSPLVDGKRNPAVMKQLCGLARGELNQASVDRFVAASGETTDSLKKKGGVTALLVNGNVAAQQIACASYLATAPLVQVDGNEFIAPKLGADGKPQVDQARLSEVMAVRIALARTDAEYFSLIAQKLEQTPGLTDAQYQARTRELFAELAPAYLKRVKEMMPPAGTRFDLKRMDEQRFAFTTSNGGEYEYSSDGMTLRQDNITWYGDGQLMGQRHTLKIAYYPDVVTQNMK
ncbi:hypothetical protein NK553_23990 [Pseudomonas sp. ZM23]|uniref:Lipoprotein n=1 Tax=Pseudomonas triclosanedens TaxID=2961893 RepID=A0ABY6ZSD8_9PSED|nr:hypothetical protein [Pseudomonas triclosanedens]MCP8467020.1 hypothetical protein [Pseudomonas triclosanedens]MCP8472832.1 hypothetical protein [Pseudomonas triclosanedens]MCP8478263.1 hypothetical protein [Pseudomonas triclosanedens]WAI47668.1 hypothetical protein OU419_18020 [Pseudomonas triclosanedens]